MFTRTLLIIACYLIAGCDDAKPQATSVRTERATFAAGCFWGAQETFRKLDGVVATTAGFSGGHVDRPTYKDLCSGASGHAETVEVEFDPARISYAELLDAFWSCHDPTALHITGREFGEPQRSIIFFHDEEQHRIALASRAQVDSFGAFERKIATEIIPASAFFPAEKYHQQYLAKLGQPATCGADEQQIRTPLAAAARDQRARR